MDYRQRLDSIFGSEGYEFYLESQVSPEASKRIKIAQKLKSDKKLKEAIEEFLVAVEEVNAIYPDVLFELYTLFISLGKISDGYYCLLNAKKHISFYEGEKKNLIDRHCDLFESILKGLYDIQNEQNKFKKGYEQNEIGATIGFSVTAGVKRAVVQSLMEEICKKPYQFPDDKIIEKELKLCHQIKKTFC